MVKDVNAEKKKVEDELQDAYLRKMDVKGNVKKKADEMACHLQEYINAETNYNELKTKKELLDTQHSILTKNRAARNVHAIEQAKENVSKFSKLCTESTEKIVEVKTDAAKQIGSTIEKTFTGTYKSVQLGYSLCSQLEEETNNEQAKLEAEEKRLSREIKDLNKQRSGKMSASDKLSIMEKVREKEAEKSKVATDVEDYEKLISKNLQMSEPLAQLVQRVKSLSGFDNVDWKKKLLDTTEELDEEINKIAEEKYPVSAYVAEEDYEDAVEEGSMMQRQLQHALKFLKKDLLRDLKRGMLKIEDGDTD